MLRHWLPELRFTGSEVCRWDSGVVSLPSGEANVSSYTENEPQLKASYRHSLSLPHLLYPFPLGVSDCTCLKPSS